MAEKSLTQASVQALSQQWMKNLALPISMHTDHISTKSKKFSLRNEKGFTCHIPPLNKAYKQGEMPLLIISPIPFIVEFREWMGLRMGKGIYPCFFAVSRGGVWQVITKSLFIS